MTITKLSDHKPVSSSILEKGCLAMNLPRQRTSIVADYLKKTSTMLVAAVSPQVEDFGDIDRPAARRTVCVFQAAKQTEELGVT